MSFVRQIDGRTEEFSPPEQVVHAHTALRIAAERIGQNNFRKMGKKYHVTPEHRAVCDAMPAVLSGTLTPDEAMGLLHAHDVLEQRLGL